MPSKYIRKGRPVSSPRGSKLPPTGTDADLNLASMSRMFSDESAAREFLEAKRWPNGPVCPHCGCTEIYKLTAHKLTSKRPMRPGVHKCKSCRKQFTVRVGTIFEESKLPLRKWLMAIHLMTSSKKGVSSHQLARELDCTVKTAWFLSHRIRECMKLEPMAGMLSGVVEADEVWIGGKPRHHQTKRPTEYKPGRKWTSKTPVLVLVERDGNAVCRPLPEVTIKEIAKAAMVAIAPDSTLMTDEARHYIGMGRQFAEHHSVNHSAKEYARKLPSGLSANSNTAESFIALLRRGHFGIFHQISKKHLYRYCNEFRFRWDHRKTTDGQRMVAAVNGAEGKRLKYKGPVDRLE